MSGDNKSTEPRVLAQISKFRLFDCHPFTPFEWSTEIIVSHSERMFGCFVFANLGRFVIYTKYFFHYYLNHFKLRFNGS